MIALKKLMSFWLKNRSLVNLTGTLALVLIFAAIRPAFLSVANLYTLLGSITVLWVVALGLTFVLLTGGFDLSVGSNLALSGIVLAWLFTSMNLPIAVAVILTIAFGMIIGGAVNGVLIGKIGASFMIVTLGTLTLFRGLVNLTSGTETKPVVSGHLDQLAFGRVFGVPISLFVLLLTFGVAWYVLQHTYFGRDVYAVGGNPEAARLAGVRVSRVIILVYAIAGGAAAIGGIFQAARLGSASPLVGEAIMFDAAAAVLLGGTSLRGGSGGVVGTAIGVLFLGVLSNGLSVAGVPSFWQQIISGFILATAAIADQLQNGGFTMRFRRRPAKQEAAVIE